MSQNELRRDPLTGGWAVIVKNGKEVSELLLSDFQPKAAIDLQDSSADLDIEILRLPEHAQNSSEIITQVIAEKHPVLQIHGEVNNRGVGLYDMCDGIGAHEIVKDAPTNPLPFEELPVNHIESILGAYQRRVRDLKNDARFRYVLIHKYQPETTRYEGFKPMSHIIATPITPLRVRQKLESSMKYYQYKERCLCCDISWQELEAKKRIITENEAFIAISPFASQVPFHMIILPKRHEAFFENNGQISLLADMLKDVLQRLKKVTGQNSYEFFIHSGPNTTAARKRGYWKTIEKDWHWHVDIQPQIRLVRPDESRIGFPVNMIPPEKATQYLKSA